MQSRALVAVLLAGALAIGMLATTVGYVDQRDVVMTVSAVSRVKCDQKATITTKIVTAKKARPVSNQGIKWLILKSRSSRDKLSSYKSYTNRQGLASVKLTFGPRSGSRIVQASIPGSRRSITVTCSGGLN
jgi:hypothetical protein